MIKKPILYDRETYAYYFECPHSDCGLMIQVPKNQVNCRIFRHAVYKDTGEQINPHTPREVCDKLRNSGSIYGCGRPFYLETVDSPHVRICGYI